MDSDVIGSDDVEIAVAIEMLEVSGLDVPHGAPPDSRPHCSVPRNDRF